MKAATRSRQERQRERIRALLDADPDRSSTSIAREIGCGVNTVIRTRERHMSREAENGTPKPTHVGMANLVEPAGPENARAATHHAYSARALAPRVGELTDELRSVVPNCQPADEPTIKLLALMLAKVEAISAWIDERGLFRNEAKGELWPVLAAQSKWVNTAARLADQLGLTPTARVRLGVIAAGEDGYARYLQITRGGDGDGD